MNHSLAHSTKFSHPSATQIKGESSKDAGKLDANKRGSVRALLALNFCIADVQNGMRPYVSLFLQSAVGWGPAQIGTALAAGNLAQVIAQTPAGALIDRLRQKARSADHGHCFHRGCVSRHGLVDEPARCHRRPGATHRARFMVVAAVSGRLASRIGRKPFFLFAFAALAVRGVLYTLSNQPAAFIAVQCMDGLGAGIFGGRQHAHRRRPDCPTTRRRWS